jgi:NAD+ kinase
VLIVAHTAAQRVAALAAKAREQLAAAGFEVRMLTEEADDCGLCFTRSVQGPEAAVGCELVLVLGGDGTFLRAAEYARPAGVPMLGVNLGHVGFLAEVDPDAFETTVSSIVAQDYTVDERVTVDADIWRDGELIGRAWALNEASLERTNRERMLEVAVSVDQRPLLRFGCDGVLCATPTGSTAYAFSAGGPVMWPSVDAMLVVPNAAHALFSRPIIVAPSSVVEIELLSHEGVLSCDGRRSVDIPAGAVVRVRRGHQSIRIVRMRNWSFADRLVSKFQLPVRTLREALGEPRTDTPELS